MAVSGHEGGVGKDWLRINVDLGPTWMCPQMDIHGTGFLGHDGIRTVPAATLNLTDDGLGLSRLRYELNTTAQAHHLYTPAHIPPLFSTTATKAMQCLWLKALLCNILPPAQLLRGMGLGGQR